MEFKIKKKVNENIHLYPTADVKTAEIFADKAKSELGDFLKGIILFGSTARREEIKESDIDILVVTDDLSFQLTDALVEAYRIIIEKIIAEVSRKLHVTSMSFTSFWEYTKAGDPVVINILRDGVALYDSGFFDPLQRLLKQGRIRPTEESVWRYFGRAPRTLVNSRWHLLQATLDLYWAVIDAAHAALMKKGEIPPTPEKVADLLEKVFVKKKLLENSYVRIMRKFYKLSKMITHREIREIKGPEYEIYLKEASAFIQKMRILIEKERF